MEKLFTTQRYVCISGMSTKKNNTQYILSIEFKMTSLIGILLVSANEESDDK